MLRHPIRRLAGLAACAGLLGAGCDQEGPNIDVESAIPVRVQPVARGPIAEYLAATATVEAAREALLACEESGRFRLQANPRTGSAWAMGDRVEAGDLIARLENAEFENQVSIESKALQLASAQREYDKQKGLFEHGGITLVWVLAESHLVIHVWPARDFVTIDLHVCDDRSSQLLKAVRLRDALDGFCFPPGTGTWHASTAGR